MQNNDIVPNCRYGHGDLQLLAVNYPKTNKKIQFAFVASENPELRYVGKIYTCSVCGYTEFFDDQPAETARAIARAKG